jgi:hypothetical protein
MIDWTKPIETMTGLPAKVISNDYRSSDWKIRKVLQVEDKSNSFTLIVDEEGFPSLIGNQCIRNVKVKKEGWLAIYAGQESNGTKRCSFIYEALEDVMFAVGGNRLVSYSKVTWEE